MERYERRSFAPIKDGDEVDVKIEAVGTKGDGITKIKGFVIIIPGAKEGDIVKVRITKVLRKVGFAEVIGEATGEPISGDEPEGENSGEEGSADEGSEETESHEDSTQEGE